MILRPSISTRVQSRYRAARTPIELPAARPAFTLIELMISLAIALALILGVNQIFAISAKTVGAGQALGTISRDDRTAHSIMWPDVHNIYLGPTPGLIINSSRVYAFRSRADQASAVSATDPSQILVNGTAVTASNIAFSDRSHRIDTIGFFASGDLYHRQTGTGTSFLTQQTSTEAWIWYGHVALPSNGTLSSATPTYYAPGDPTRIASRDNNAYASEFILGRVAILLVPNPSGADCYVGANPLGTAATSSAGTLQVGTGSDGFPIVADRFDEAQISITSFLANPALTTQAARVAMTYRFAANPFPLKPLSSASMAATAPVFIRNCSQFCVEYAGDYITQDATTGAVLKTVPDTVSTAGGASVIDFVVDNDGTHKTRWYGFPRDINNDGVITAVDVVPLRDIRGTQATFERTLPANSAAPGNAEHYVCTWGPDTDQINDPPPKLIRITMALDDPSGRVGSAQIFEYVIDVQ